jgi:ribosomal protein S18 acetylase RimI-like enzyme
MAQADISTTVGSAADSCAIRVLRWQDERSVAALLSRAFIDDPLVERIYEAGPAARLRRMMWSFRVAIRGHFLHAQPAWTITDGGTAPLGVVLVTRPRPPLHAGSDALFTLRALLHIGWRAGFRGARAASIIAAHAPTTPFTYLRTLGVDPDRHGRGLGSQLVEQVLRTGPLSVPIYLETAKEGNLSFYQRHGFRCAGEFRCLGIPVWRLLRPASG